MRVILSGYAWLDADELTDQQKANLRHKLTVYPSRTSEHDNKDPPPISLYAEDDERGLFGVPRRFYLENRRATHEEIVNVSEGFRMKDFESLMRYEGEYAEQLVAIDVIIEKLKEFPHFGGTILKGGCGLGKTNIALSLARRLGLRTLILVHKEFLMNQWRRRIEEFMPDARVGIIRQGRCEFRDVDFAVAMLDSLGSRVDVYPSEMYDAFGLVVTDEVHRTGAATWAPILPRFSAKYRVGLTATPRRKDDAEGVFFQHIGPIGYSARTRPVLPLLRKIVTDTNLRGKMGEGGKIKKASELGRTEMVTQLSKVPERTRQIMEDVFQGVKRGRKVLVLSERIEHLKDMAGDLNSLLSQADLPFVPTIDFYVGEWFTGETDEDGQPLMVKVGKGRNAKMRLKTKRRTEGELREAESANVIFATVQMVSEGLDIQALDVLVIGTPIGDIEQAAGRVRRRCKPSEDKCKRLCPWRAGVCQGKPQPIITDVIDEDVPQAKGKWRSRARFYRQEGML